MKPIINISSVELKPNPFPAPETTSKAFGGRLAQLGPLVGAQKLGCGIIVVEPGKRVFPFHNHRVNEELFLVLEGTGEVRIGAETYPIGKGDLMVHAPGGPETAHQIINTGTEELRYFAVSTKESPEIADYPDTGKFGVLADGGTFRFLGKVEDSLGYWDGE